MSYPNLISDERLEEELKNFPLWKRDKNYILREFVGANFSAAVGMVNAIALVAEKLDHHPDILIYGWNKIRVTTLTHAKGGLTEKDFELAKKIEELNF